MKTAISTFTLFIFSLVALLFSNASHGQLTPEQSITIEQLRILSADNMEGRKVPSPGYQKAKSYLIDEFKHQGVTPFQQYSNYQQTFVFGSQEKTGTNIIGYIPGHKYPDRFFVITAHYDHLGKKGSRVFNGANDNASGVVAMLSLIKHFSLKQSNYGLIFVATDAEESGLYGAKHLVKHLPVKQEKILLNINLDMIGDGGKRNTLYYIHSNKPKSIKLAMKQLVKTLSNHEFKLRKFRPFANRSASVVRDVDWKNASDHAAFRRIGIPYLYFGTQVNKVYHSVKDDFEHIEQDFFLASVATIIKIVQQLQYLEPEVLIPSGAE